MSKNLQAKSTKHGASEAKVMNNSELLDPRKELSEFLDRRAFKDDDPALIDLLGEMNRDGALVWRGNSPHDAAVRAWYAARSAPYYGERIDKIKRECTAALAELFLDGLVVIYFSYEPPEIRWAVAPGLIQ